MRSAAERAAKSSLNYEPIWVESNAQKDAARALEMLHVQLISTVIDPYAWKWTLLILHHTVHAFLVASLGVPDDREASAPVEHGRTLQIHPHRAGGGATVLPHDLPGLYSRMKRATGFRPEDEIDEHIARLDAYRNGLFGPVFESWTLKVNELPRLTRGCLHVVEHLGWNPGHIDWQKENLTDLARVKFIASTKVLEALASRYHGAS
jgi:hypothetical protein